MIMATPTLILLVSAINGMHSQLVRCNGGTCDCPSSPIGITCILDCSDNDICKGEILNCREGDECEIKCGGKRSCSEGTTINGNTATDVTILCEQQDSCKTNIDIKCGTGHCILQCNKPHSCTNFGSIHINLSYSFQCIGICPPHIPLPFTATPTSKPTVLPTIHPTPAPTLTPSQYPSKSPLFAPTLSPSSLQITSSKSSYSLSAISPTKNTLIVSNFTEHTAPILTSMVSSMDSDPLQTINKSSTHNITFIIIIVLIICFAVIVIFSWTYCICHLQTEQMEITMFVDQQQKKIVDITSNTSNLSSPISPSIDVIHHEISFPAVNINMKQFQSDGNSSSVDDTNRENTFEVKEDGEDEEQTTNGYLNEVNLNGSPLQYTCNLPPNVGQSSSYHSCEYIDDAQYLCNIISPTFIPGTDILDYNQQNMRFPSPKPLSPATIRVLRINNNIPRRTSIAAGQSSLEHNGLQLNIGFNEMSSIPHLPPIPKFKFNDDANSESSEPSTIYSNNNSSDGYDGSNEEMVIVMNIPEDINTSHVIIGEL